MAGEGPSKKADPEAQEEGQQEEGKEDPPGSCLGRRQPVGLKDGEARAVGGNVAGPGEQGRGTKSRQRVSRSVWP